MSGRPLPNEAASNYFKYIDKVSGDDALLAMRSQLDESMKMLSAITEEKSLHKYAPEKWTIRQVLNHVSDTERAFAYRTLWFARGFETPLSGYDPDLAAAGAQANEISWSSHVEEFKHVRNATISLFQNLSPEAWMRTGTASGKLFTVRAIAFLVSGHAAHHFEMLREKYLA